MLFNSRILKVRFLFIFIVFVSFIFLNLSVIYSLGNISFLFILLVFLVSLIYSCIRIGKVIDNCGLGSLL